MAIEIVSFPTKNDDFPQLCKRLLGGSHGFDGPVGTVMMSVSALGALSNEIGCFKDPKRCSEKIPTGINPFVDHHPI